MTRKRRGEPPTPVVATDAPETETLENPFEEPAGHAVDFGIDGDIWTFDEAKVLRLKKLAENGHSLQIAEIQVKKYAQGGWLMVRKAGPEAGYYDWCRKNLPPGRYSLQAINERRMYLVTAQILVEPTDQNRAVDQDAARLAGTGDGDHGGGMQLEKELIRAILIKAINGESAGPAREDPMREALANMAKMMQMQVNMMSLKMMKSESGGDGGASQVVDRVVSLLEKQVNAKPAAGGTGSFAELMPILNLGMQLGSRMNGTGEKKDELPPWAQIAPELADTVGVPLIVTLAQAMLPTDKAQAVLEAINGHIEARRAEAENPPINTTGEPVK